MGIDWPPGCGGKTTLPAKEVWAAAAAGGGDNSLSEKILNEKNWRFNYIPHIVKVYELLAQEKGVDACKAGLAKLRDTFVFRNEDGVTTTLQEIGDVSVTESKLFNTRIVKGNGLEAGNSIVTVPYQGQKLTAEDGLFSQLEAWASYGTCEKDVVQKIREVVPRLTDSGSWKGKVIVILGAGSELGPLKSLLQWGATVVAVRTRKQEEWKKLEEFCKTTGGKLMIPVSKTNAQEAGCDILTEVSFLSQ